MGLSRNLETADLAEVLVLRPEFATHPKDTAITMETMWLPR